MKETYQTGFFCKAVPVYCLVVIVLMCSFSTGWSSVSAYAFNSNLSSYESISGGTIHGTTTNDNESFNSIPIGFNFTYNAANYNVVSIHTNGFLAMGSSVTTSTTPISSTSATNNVVAALGRDIKSRDNGEIMSLTSGIAPNRVFIVQWRHYRRIPSACSNDDFDFQIQLFENANKVVIVYGSFTTVTSASSQSIQVGLRGNSNTDFNNRTTTSNWAATTAGSTNTSTCSLSATVFPSNGLTFTWASNLNPVNPAINPIPANNSTNIGISTNLLWQDGGGNPTGYKLYLGTNNPPSNVVNGNDLGLVTEYNPVSDLLYSTTYYWKIVPYSSQGDASGCLVWSFTTSPPPVAQIELSAPSINFGTVFLSSNSSQTLYARNTGTAPLIIGTLSWVAGNPAFSINGFMPGTTIAVGDSVAIDLVFSPTVFGTVSDSLLITNNSSNSPGKKIKATGFGQYVAPKSPTNVTIVMDGSNAVISWDVVTQSVFDTPITPDYYIIYYNVSGNLTSTYSFLGLSSSTQYTHTNVGMVVDSAFYKVVAVKLY